MKKLSMLFTALLIIVTFFSCQTEETPYISNSDTTTKSDYSKPEKPTAENLNIDTVIYECGEGISLESNTQSSDFSTKIYKDDFADKALDIDVLGTEHSLLYDNSCVLAFTDIKAHAYTSQDGNSKFLINAETGGIVKYINMPYENILTSENDYINFIQKLIGSKSDLSEYGDYEIYTHLYIQSDNEFRSTTKEGFYNKFNVGETFGSYMFFFNKTIAGTETMEHIIAIFDENTFSLEVYDLDYEEEKFSDILNNLDELKKAAERHIISRVQDNYNILDVKISSASMFVKDGNSYVKFYIDAIISLDGYEEYSFVSPVTVICNYTATQKQIIK